VVQADEFNRSRIGTVVVVALTSNLALGEAPGNVPLSARQSRLPKRSVANVSQILTLDKRFLRQRVGRLAARQFLQVEDGIRLVLAL
jgi:mRNA interferase MazF